MTYILYLNGLGTGKPRKREQIAMRYVVRYFKRHDMTITHIPINWFSQESFDRLYQDTVQTVRAHCKKHDRVVLVGVSAGGSLAVNVMSQLHDPKLSVVTVCSPLRITTLPWWDKRNLAYLAKLGTSKPSQRLFDSVTCCNNTAIPNLTMQDKQRIITVRQWMDQIVPKSTMTVPGIRTYRVPGIGHIFGIIAGALKLPAILKETRLL